MLQSFDPIGFGIPFLLAMAFSVSAIRNLYFTQWLLLFLSGVITYTFANEHQIGQTGVGLMPVYVICIIEYMFRRAYKKVKRVPAAAFLSAAFFSLAIPDILRTSEWFPNGTVGGGGYKDGLILFWLLPALPIIAAWTIPEIKRNRKGWRATHAQYLRAFRWNFQPCVVNKKHA